MPEAALFDVEILMALLKFLFKALQLKSEKNFEDSLEPHFRFRCLQTILDGDRNWHINNS